jgi:hypothetical protein
MNAVAAPDDYLDPNWNHGLAQAEWVDFIGEPVREIWKNFSDEQRKRLAANADAIAMNLMRCE